MMKQRFRNLILIIKILLRVPGYEWFSPAVRKYTEDHPEMWRDQ